MFPQKSLTNNRNAASFASGDKFRRILEAMNGQQTQNQTNRHYTLKTAPLGVVAIMAAQNLSSAQQQAKSVFEKKQINASGNVWIQESSIEEIMQHVENGGYLPVLS